MTRRPSGCQLSCREEMMNSTQRNGEGEIVQAIQSLDAEFVAKHLADDNRLAARFGVAVAHGFAQGLVMRLIERQKHHRVLRDVPNQFLLKNSLPVDGRLPAFVVALECSAVAHEFVVCIESKGLNFGFLEGGFGLLQELQVIQLDLGALGKQRA